MSGLTSWEEFNPHNKKLILSIDGGGMRGVIPLAMLAHMEEQLKKPAYEIFDLVAGTSTGAIIAAGLALGYSAEFMLKEVYRSPKGLPGAFGNKGLKFWLRFIFPFCLRYQYSWKPFVDTLTKFDGVTDATIDSLYPPPPSKKRPVILMTAKDLRTTNTYYIVTDGPGRKEFEDWPLIGAVAASGAATIFFRPIDGNLVDGGVGAFGNPCFAVATEAFEYLNEWPIKPRQDQLEEQENTAFNSNVFKHEFLPENTILISLGTGHVDVGLAHRAGYRRGIIGWFLYMVLGSIVETAVQQTLVTRALYQKRLGLDFRRYNVNLTREVAQKLGVNPELLKELDPKDLGLDTIDSAQLELMEEIGRKYAAKIDWTKPNQLPWHGEKESKETWLPQHHVGQPEPKLPKEYKQLQLDYRIDWTQEKERQWGDPPTLGIGLETIKDVMNNPGQKRTALLILVTILAVVLIVIQFAWIGIVLLVTVFVLLNMFGRFGVYS